MQRAKFKDRTDAGRRLAEALLQQPRPENPLVLALPQGGVAVAVEIARTLGSELDVLVVRKLGHPLQPELAIGAIATGGIRVLNPELAGVLPTTVIDAIAAREGREVERRSTLYRGESPLELRGRDVILVDDGLATGATMLAAVRAARESFARHVTVAVPVGDPKVCVRLAREADRVVCLLQPAALTAVGSWYDDFPQLTDDDVRAALAAARSANTEPAASVR